MKHVLFGAAFAAVLGAAPAMADPPGQQMFDAAAHRGAYAPDAPNKGQQCFNGKAISGVNRVGDRTVYVQTTRGTVYSLELAGACDALKAAQNITLRAAGTNAVCTQAAAQLVVHTPAGARRCSVADVSVPTRSELASLAAPPR